MLRVLVLGGTGFIGRQVVAALAARGHELAIGTRRPGRALRRMRKTTPAACREAHFEALTRPDAWRTLVASADVVVNAVGILRERGAETYDRVHHRAPAALAAACAAAGVRLIHVSALGLHAGARSGFISSKLFGEAALMTSGADYIIVRPSLLDGEGGLGARWMRALARMPVHMVPATALGRIAALDVRDLGEAIAILCESWTPRRVIELGGTRHRRMAEHLAALRALHTDRPAVLLRVPEWLARVASHVCDLLHISPLSFGHLELMKRDNVPADNLLPLILGRTPRTVGAEPARKTAVHPDRNLSRNPSNSRRYGSANEA